VVVARGHAGVCLVGLIASGGTGQAARRSDQSGGPVWGWRGRRMVLPGSLDVRSAGRRVRRLFSRYSHRRSLTGGIGRSLKAASSGPPAGRLFRRPPKPPGSPRLLWATWRRFDPSSSPSCESNEARTKLSGPARFFQKPQWHVRFEEDCVEKLENRGAPKIWQM
jgi:hypothetical protein